MNPAYLALAYLYGHWGCCVAHAGQHLIPKRLFNLASLLWPLTLVYLCFALDKTTEVPCE